MSWPPAVTVPVVGVTIPQTMLMSVVLPAPLGPSSARISPFTMSRSTFFSACRPEAYVLVRLEIERIGGMERPIVPSPSGPWRFGIAPRNAGHSRTPPVTPNGEVHERAPHSRPRDDRVGRCRFRLPPPGDPL